MSTEIVKHENAFSEIMSIGKAFAESGLFADIKSAAQAIVKIQAGAELGLPPVASMTGIHLIQGKIVVGAGLLASRVKGSGKYNYRVLQHDDKACSIEFLEGTTPIGRSSFTIEDAKKAGTKNLDRFPRNMLFARAMSNGVKWYTPDLFGSPVYVPGELNDEQPVQEAEVVQPEYPAEVVQAVEQLLHIEDVDGLKEWKKRLPAAIAKHPEVIACAKQRYSELTNKAA